MVEQTPMFRVTTGNIFGVAERWPETFYRRAKEIVAEMDDVLEHDSNYCCNPAFAGAWVTVFEKRTADRIQKCWNQLLPLALRSMSPRWRAEYDKSMMM